MNNVINYCKNFIKSSLDISVKDEESERGLSLSETCSFTSGAGEETSEQQQQGPSSVSPPPALWTRDSSRSQSGFMGKDLDQDISNSAMKTNPSSPVTELNTESEDLQDPMDPLYTLPGSERRRSKSASKRRASNSNRSNQNEDLDIQEARTQKAEKAEELYATLPPIVGVIGHFNKGEFRLKMENQ